MEPEKVLPVLIVDDHALVRNGIRSVLEGHGDIQVVGEARNGIEALILVEQLRPRIVLMDINMPRMNGIEATAHIKGHYPDIVVLGLSVNTNTANQETMKRAGACRLIPKEVLPDELYTVIQEAAKTGQLSDGVEYD